MSDNFNKFKILECNNSINIKPINIDGHLTTKPKYRGSAIEFNRQKYSSKKKYKNSRKSISMSSNNPSTTVETSISGSLFDTSNNIKKKISYAPKRRRFPSAYFNENKARRSVICFPKIPEMKIVFDILFGHHYFLSNSKRDIPKLEKFIFELQIKFNNSISNLYDDNDEDIGGPLTRFKSDKNIIKNSGNSSKNLVKVFKIQKKEDFFKKLEDLIAMYSLIIFFFVRIQNMNKAKILYLIMIKQNLKCINYLEKLINFNIIITEKNDKNLMTIFQTSMSTILKIYSFLIKYGFLLHLSFYGNLFMKRYLNLNHKYYLYSLYYHKIKNSYIENENKVKYWFAQLNFHSAYFSLSLYLPLKVSISLCNLVLFILGSIKDKYYDLKIKNLILCTIYNKSLFLYMDGKSEDAIINLNQVKRKLFIYIEDASFDDGGKKGKKSTLGAIVIDDEKKGRSRDKNFNRGILSFKELFNSITKNHLIKSSSNKNMSKKKLIVNINKKFEPYFISNKPININNLLNQYMKFCNIKIEGLDDKIRATYNSKTFKRHNTSQDRKSCVQLTNMDKRKQERLPNIFKNPILLKAEILLAEIELDRKKYRAAYTHVNHALAIITIFKKIQNNYYISKYKKEQRLIKEFLSIIDNSDIKNYSEISEKDEEQFEEEEEEEIEIRKEDMEYQKEQELNEKIKVNKKILKEVEKFFIFFSKLSAYQIKVLNDTQPNNEIRNYLPILFQNQFKDCLTVKQKMVLDNLHVMSLSRYMLLKDPNKLILPSNLNISPIYVEKPELFSPRYFQYEKKQKLILENKKNKQDDVLEKKAYQNFQEILKSKNATLYIQNFLNNNYNLIMKIIKASKEEEINKMISEPSILIKPVEKYKKQNSKVENLRMARHKSEICFSKNKILNKKISLIDERNSNLITFNNKSSQKFKTSGSNYKKINRTCTSDNTKFLINSRSAILI